MGPFLARGLVLSAYAQLFVVRGREKGILVGFSHLIQHTSASFEAQLLGDDLAEFGELSLRKMHVLNHRFLLKLAINAGTES